jgi:hypothetical protein
MIPNKEPTRDEIASRAYALYLMRDCEHGSDIQDWSRATKELTEGRAGESKMTTAAHESVSVRADLRSAWPE